MVDVLIVGGGSAGCTLAGRLTDRPGRSVLLLEAGPLDSLPELRDATSLAATAPRHPRNWAYAAELRPGNSHIVPRGKGLGGSGAINGANWTRVTPADADGWGVPGWSYADLLPHYVRAEHDHDFAGPHHGDHGPVPVVRPAGDLRHPAVDRFLEAAAKLGFPDEADKNAGGAPGAGLVPSNSLNGVRVDAASAYLVGERPGLTVRGLAPVARVLLDHGRACGVVLRSGEIIEAGEVVLCAGAVATPQVLMASGIGDGVGQGWSDHPSVYLPFADVDPGAHPQAPGSQVALDLDCGADPAGDAEVLLFVRPFVPGGDLHLMCALQAPDSRGTIELGDPRPRIAYGYLRTEHDRRRLRHAIRTAAELLRAGLGRRTAPEGDVLGNDRALDGWIAENLTTSVHMCGSAAIGRVVDAELRVIGVDGLRVADTSVIPTVPRRGPAATAVAIGEKAADLLTVEEPA
ncbi:MAG: GMC family oxidoreductase N-terminal domain-containing protein [Pseudonocardia sp.]|uniref:GMC family oxidoreductase n=1 Tax=Pseudonocardia sp. TaxID=60912 RepID=UPI001AD46305|nr:GMC family oxidoreductase N-terminal domain-containing protein [Pseudonocardia sp.]